jgi:hypothetical protein
VVAADINAHYVFDGHLQPFAQSSQHLHSQLQSGHPSQQSAEQQPPAVQQPDWAGAGVPAKPATTSDDAIANGPNRFVNI